MKIFEVLQIDINKKQVLSFVGGGGKTTSIFQLSKELVGKDKKVLISTTTKIFNPKKDEYDYYFLKDIQEDFRPKKASITILGNNVVDEKLIGVAPEKIDEISRRKIFDFILVEADGSNRKSIKAPGFHEPVIPLTTSKTIGLIALDCLNKPVDEKTVHRAELMKKIPGNENLNTINEDIIVNLVLDKSGLFKNSVGEKILILNKANKEERINAGRIIQKKLKEKSFENIVIGDIKEKSFIK